MLSSVVGALGVPSRSQFSPPPSCFCDAHFWFEQKYIDELTEVIAHEIGPQLDKLRMAPKELISKKTARLLSILQPYQDIFASITDTSSIASMKPNCPACTLSQFFQNPEAVNALSISVKGRKYRSHPWPASMAWLEPCPGKGVDWEAKWRTEGKSVGYDRVRVQRWRRENHLHEQVSEAPPQAPGHQPGEGCDFCDSLRMERADEAELDAAIAEEEDRGADDVYVDARDETTAADDDDEAESLRFSDPETLRAQAETDSDGSSTLRDSDSETLRALTEESIIKAYLTSPSKPKTTPTTKPRKTSSIYDNASQQHHPSEKVTAQQGMKKQRMLDHLAHMGENEDAGGRQERARRASDWGRSYRHLVGRGPESQTTLQFERYPEPDSSGPELWAVEGLF